jgi:hypothetical protein
MIHLSNSWFRILLIAVLVFSVSLPIYKKETSDFALLESGIEGITKKLSTDAWSFLSESANAIKEKLFEEVKPVSLTATERFWDNIRTGWQYGLSTAGAADKVLRDSMFNIYHIPSLLISLLIVFILLEVMILLFFKRLGRFLGILSLLCLLICLYVFGDLNKDHEHAVVFGGLIFFALIQLFILIAAAFSVRNSSSAQSV